MVTSADRIVRTVTAFERRVGRGALSSAHSHAERLRDLGFEVQTTRACFASATLEQAAELIDDDHQFVSVGALTTADARTQLPAFFARSNTSFHVDLTDGVSRDDVDLLFEIMENAPLRTFGFSWVVNNPASGPFFNAARFARPGFAIGLQTPNLAASALNLEDWFDRQDTIYREVAEAFRSQPSFLGIDSSVAPMGGGAGSLVSFLRRIAPDFGCDSFSELVTTEVFTRITEQIKSRNPKPVGLCGLMLPCLEDAALAEEYEAGNFTIERNLFLSMHCGLGIDTYPIGLDEDPQRVLNILQLLRALSLRHGKPLSCRFVADQRARTGERTDYQSPYLTDVTVRPL